MKKLIQKHSIYIFCIFKKHTVIKAAGLFLIIYLLFTVFSYIPSLSVKKEALPSIGDELKASLYEIPISSEDVLAAETETKKLYLNPASLNIFVVDKATNTVYNSIRTNGTVDEQSLLKITFMGEDNVFSYWDSYTYSVKNETYTIDKINDGVRINLEMKELDSYRINEYMPQKITIERYEAVFILGLDEKVEEGGLTLEEADKYKSVLTLIYAKDVEKNCYYNRYSSAPPISAIMQLIQVTKLLNYTTEDLIEDNAEFGIATEIIEPASFMIPIEAVLDGDDFVVRVPANHIQNGNKYYTLTHIDVLQNFGSVSPKEIEEGYVLVPDGAGALLELNKFDSNYGSYSRPLYNNTYYNDYFYLPSYPEELSMPVFGMLYGKGESSTGGFLGIIEEGDETAFINVNLASDKENGGGSAYNKVFSGFDSAQYSQVSILGPYDTSGGRFLSSTGMMDINYVVRYILYSEPVTYYDMAESYQDYLVSRHGLTRSYGTEPKLYLDIVGSLTKEERILGLAYNKILSMTTYKELKEILDDLGDASLVVNYLGMFNNGLYNKLMNKAELTPSNGSKSELNDLLAYSENNGIDIFFEAAFSEIYEKGNGYKESTHAIYDFYDSPMVRYKYDYASGALQGWGYDYTSNLLNPVYLSSVVDGFLKEADGFPNLYISDLAANYYANYEKNKIVSPAQSQIIIDNNFNKLTQVKTLSLNNPQMDKVSYGKYAVNISRESSGYGAIAVNIPFRQLVMNGIISYTTLNVNESGENSNYFLLQALELGSYPKYVITSKNLDLVKNSAYADFLSRQYSLICDDIKELYDKYEKAYADINSMEITNHTFLDDNIYETTYANGVKVITNYNKFKVTVQDIEIEALGYLIIK